MSNTPRTDAATLDAMCAYVSKIDHVVPVKIAAEIETELAAEREKVAKLKDTIRRARTKFCEDGADGKIAAEMFQILGESREETK